MVCVVSGKEETIELIIAGSHIMVFVTNVVRLDERTVGIQSLKLGREPMEAEIGEEILVQKEKTRASMRMMKASTYSEIRDHDTERQIAQLEKLLETQVKKFDRL